MTSHILPSKVPVKREVESRMGYWDCHKAHTMSFWRWKMFLKFGRLLVHFLLKKFFLIDFYREKKGERERTTSLWEQLIRLAVSCMPPLPAIEPATLGMCPEWELNQQLFVAWDNTQPVVLHWPGLWYTFMVIVTFMVWFWPVLRTWYRSLVYINIFGSVILIYVF